jgi:hypothetical protein
MRLVLVVLSVSSPIRAATCGGASGLDLQSQSLGFGAGSLIVPMDTCNNPDKTYNPGPTNTGGACGGAPDYSHPGGARCYNLDALANVRHPFGIVYLWLQNGIPVHVILNNQKVGLADADFSVSSTSSGTANTVTLLKQDASGLYQKVLPSSGVNCGTNTVYYASMPFVVDSGFTQQALSVLQAFNASHANELADVPLHVANYAFTAPVLGTLASRPKPVLIDSPPLDSFFDDSGIPDTVAGNTTYLMMNGSYSFDWPASLGPNGVCSTRCNTLSDADGRNLVDVVWSTNFNGKSGDIGILNSWPAMPTFFKQGGTLLAFGSAQAWESVSGGNLGGTIQSASKADAKGPFCAAVVGKSSSSPLADPGTAPAYPASNRFLQIGDTDFTLKGNSGGEDGSSLYEYPVAPSAAGTEGLANSKGYGVISGHALVGGTQTPGNLVYLGSLNSWKGGSGGKDGGLHIMYDSLIVGTGCGVPSVNVPAELTRSTAVATFSATSVKVAEYLGSFDWFLPKNPSAMGNVLYTPDPTVYPYMTGHFREYKQAGTFTSNASTNYKVCDAASALSACNWDAATKLPAFASRSVYVVTGSAGNWSLTAAAGLTASDAALSYVSTHLDKNGSGILGGVDFGTPAVIEGLATGLVTVGNARGRPTIAYVGARDGMLHAFCVGGAGGKCYGKNPGEEIWAVITPGMRKLLNDAYNGGSQMDWSRVNLGGIIRVADIQDSWGGSAGYRTVLLVGSHDSGYVEALDISDPDPARLNQPGFSFLWEQDGSTRSDGTTQEPMGKTWGATFALTGSANGGAAAVLSASSCRGMSGCPASVQNGMNVYLLRMLDGKVVSTFNTTYTRSSSLYGAPINNDVPATPTTLDANDDGFDETMLVPSLEGYVYRYTLKAGTAPTLATLDKRLTLFDASGSRCSDSGIACEPIGAPITIVRNLKGPPLGAVVVTGGADWARTPAANQSYHIYEFDPQADALTGGYASRALPAMTPPVSGAPGAGAGITGTSMSLRSFSQPTVSGSDLYAAVTTLSVGQLSQAVQPLITPGTYGTVLRFANINDGTTLSTAVYAVPQGTAFAGSAGSTVTVSTANGGVALFANDVTGGSGKMLQAAPGTSTPSTAFAVNQAAAGGRNFTVQTWLDVE